MDSVTQHIPKQFIEIILANAWHYEAEQCYTRPGQVRSSLGTDSGYQNMKFGIYPKSLRPFLWILCVVDDFACRRIFSGLSEDAFDALASLRWQSLVFTLWFNLCLQIIFAHKV